MSVSTERLDELIRIMENIRDGEGYRPEYAKALTIGDGTEWLDIFRDAKRWREHVRPPTRCDHRLDR